MKQKRFILLIAAVLLLVFPALAVAATPPKLGERGWKIKIAQEKLNVVGVTTPVTGVYSKDTAEALRKFQKTNKLTTNGLLDDKTYAKLVGAAFEREGIRGVSGKAVVRTVAKYKGVPYTFGGATPKGFDCSGYVNYVFNEYKAKLPRTADAQCLAGIFVLQKDLREGDLVFFITEGSGPSHVGIYAGNANFWHASSSKGIMLSNLREDYWRTRYYRARRVLTEAGR